MKAHWPTAGIGTPQALVELAPDIITVIDRKALFQYVSPAVGRILGYDARDLVGRRVEAIVHPPDIDGARGGFKAMLRSRGPVRLQHRFRAKEGACITLETIGRNGLDLPGFEGIVCCSREVAHGAERVIAPRDAPEGGLPEPVLSAREREVLELVAEGLSSKEIAARLGIAPGSVSTYRGRLMHKLNVNGMTGLVRFAIRHGLVRA